MGKVDWSEAPKNADFYVCNNFYFKSACKQLYVFDCEENKWIKSSLDLSLISIKGLPSYEKRPNVNSGSIDDYKAGK